MNNTVKALISFDDPIYCNADVLGKRINLVLAGFKAEILLPSLVWGDDKKNPLNVVLKPPVGAESLKREGRPLFWGRPCSSPYGDSQVYELLLEVSVSGNIQTPNVCQSILDSFRDWFKLFFQYAVLFTQHNSKRRVIADSSRQGMRLQWLDSEVHREITYKNEPITIISYDEDWSLHAEQFQKAAAFASQGIKPKFEYLLLLAAYEGNNVGDYRKAILEAACAIEVTLGKKIRAQSKELSENVIKALLKKYQTLRGLFELIQLLQIDIPENISPEYLIKLRNNVMHTGLEPDFKEANKFIDSAKLLLNSFAPEYADIVGDEMPA